MLSYFRRTNIKCHYNGIKLLYNEADRLTQEFDKVKAVLIISVNIIMFSVFNGDIGSLMCLIPNNPKEGEVHHNHLWLIPNNPKEGEVHHNHLWLIKNKMS